MARRHLFSSLGFYERSASAACSRRAAHALRRLGFRFLKESESDLLDARSGLWSAAFASREESKSKWRPGHPVVSSLYAARISYPITRRRPTGLQLIVCARAAPRLAEGFMPVAPARAVTTWSTLRARFYFPCARAAPRLAEGFMPVAPARAVTTRSTLHACCVRPPAPAPASIAGIQQPPKCSSNSGLITCEVWVVELDDPNPRQSTQRERVRVVVG